MEREAIQGDMQVEVGGMGRGALRMDGRTDGQTAGGWSERICHQGSKLAWEYPGS